MQEVTLITEDGALVVIVIVPALRPMPRALSYESRVFLWMDDYTYAEAIPYQVERVKWES